MARYQTVTTKKVRSLVCVAGQLAHFAQSISTHIYCYDDRQATTSNTTKKTTLKKKIAAPIKKVAAATTDKKAPVPKKVHKLFARDCYVLPKTLTLYIFFEILPFQIVSTKKVTVTIRFVYCWD